MQFLKMLINKRCQIENLNAVFRSEINLFEIITKQNVQGVPVNVLCSVFSVVSEISLWFKIQSDVEFFEESHTAKIFRRRICMIRFGSKPVCRDFQESKNYGRTNLVCMIRFGSKSISLGFQVSRLGYTLHKKNKKVKK